MAILLGSNAVGVESSIIGDSVTNPMLYSGDTLLTASGSGTLVQISGWVRSVSGTDNFRFLIYDSLGNLLGQTEEFSASSGYGLYTAQLLVPVAVVAGTQYRLAFIKQAGYLTYGRLDGAATWTVEFLQSPGLWENMDPWPAGAQGGGYQFPAIYAESGAVVAPTISSVTPSTITPNSTPTLSGSDFGATPQAVLLSPTDDRADVAAAAQTIGGGAGNTSVPTTGVVLPTGAAHGDTLYYFVQAENGEWNAAGYAVTLSLAPAPAEGEIFGATTDGFRLRYTADADNGTMAWAVFATAVQRDAWATPVVEPGSLTQPANSLAWGTQAVSTTGVQETALITGLGENQTRYYRIYHYGDVTA